MFTFNIGPSNVTKKLLLSKFPEEAYMSFYLGINPGPGLFKSPLRPDNSPTCAFYRTRKGELYFKDFRGDFNGNFIDVVMFKYGIDYNKALNTIANDFNIVDKPHYVKNQPMVKYDGSVVDTKGSTAIQCKIKDFSKEDLKFWNSFGITLNTLKKYNVFSIEDVFINGVYHNSSYTGMPIYGYYFGKKDSIEEWKIYYPKKTNYRFLLNTNVLQGYKQLPKTGRFVVVTKSLKDVMSFHEMGIPAVAPQNENVILTKTQAKNLQKRFGLIIVNGDWDPAGISFMRKSRMLFRCMTLSIKDKVNYGKDISDLIKIVGIDKAKELIADITKDILIGKYNYQLTYAPNPVLDDYKENDENNENNN